jgi:hypothetical protein
MGSRSECAYVYLGLLFFLFFIPGIEEVVNAVGGKTAENHAPQGVLCCPFRNGPQGTKGRGKDAYPKGFKKIAVCCLHHNGALLALIVVGLDR